MNNLQVFNNEQFGEVRVFSKDNENWFVAKDVCSILDLSNPTVAIQNLDTDEVTKLNLGGKIGETNLINESGLYTLIIRSRKDEAKKFRKWVTGEVLPSIRKHGMFAQDELLDNPDLLIAAATKLKEERQARIEAEKQVLKMKPKAEFYDDVAGSKDSIEVGHVAKVLAIKGIGRNKLFEILRDKKILDKNNIPYQTYVDRGYFRILEQKYQVPTGEIKINIKTMVFQKGIEYIRNIIRGKSK